MALNYHLLFKVLLVGDPEVGKATILHQSGNESSCPSTVGVNFLKRKLELDGKRIKLQIWNIAGQESSQASSTSYYHGTQGFILAYDVTDRASYDKILGWLSIIEHHASEQDFQRILVANNCRSNERKREITKEEGEKFAREYGMRYAEINDLQSLEIDEVLKLLIQDILSHTGSQEEMEKERAVSEDFGPRHHGIKIEQDEELLLG